MQRIRADLSGRNASARVVVVAHAFVVGGEVSTSERDVSVGGVPSAPSAVFDGAHYVALGHLHGPQQPASIATDAVLRYSGSPLRYSISERNHDKSVTIVELDATGNVQIELVSIVQERPIVELRGTLEQVLAEENEVHRQSWVKVVITDELAPDDWRAILRQHFPYSLEIEHESSGAHRAIDMVQVDRNSNPVEISTKFITNVRSSPVNDDERAILDDVIAEIRRREAQV
jgi:exonuclease SbcD